MSKAGVCLTVERSPRWVRMLAVPPLALLAIQAETVLRYLIRGRAGCVGTWVAGRRQLQAIQLQSLCRWGA